MPFNPNRRQMLMGTAASLSLLGLGLSAGRAMADDVRLRYFFWGGPGRSDRKVDSVQKYAGTQQGLSIDAEWSPWGDYWPRLSTQIAGGNAPDVIQMDYQYIYEYARRGVLMPLDGFIPKPMDISSFGDQRLASGKVDGKLYGVTIGDNAYGIGHDADALKAAGCEIPDDLTWDSFRDLCAKFAKANTRPNYFATDNMGGNFQVFQIWLRQDGKDLYTADGLGFSAADLEAWLTYWKEMSDKGYAASADVQGLYQDKMESSLVATNHAAMAPHWSNEVNPVTALVKFKFDMAPFPQRAAGGKSGFYLKPSQFMSIYSKSKYPDASAALINYLTNTLASAKDQGVDTAIPPAPAVREALLPDLPDTSKRSVAFVAKIEKRADPLPLPPLPGNGEAGKAFEDNNMQVLFGNISPKDAASVFIAQANEILTRAKAS
jgi:multiple sugar transport system substrate-binding protein